MKRTHSLRISSFAVMGVISPGSIHCMLFLHRWTHNALAIHKTGQNAEQRVRLITALKTLTRVRLCNNVEDLLDLGITSVTKTHCVHDCGCADRHAEFEDQQKRGVFLVLPVSIVLSV